MHGTLSVINGNQVTYIPNNGYEGLDSFTFYVNDGNVNSNIATVSITVTHVNQAPIAYNQNVTMPQDSTKTITLFATDLENDVLTYYVFSNSQHGTLTQLANNVYSYTPNPLYNGHDEFSFVVWDGSLWSNVATISINITPVNYVPYANANGPYRGIEGVPITLNATKSYDPLGFALQYRWDVDSDGIYDTSWLSNPLYNHIYVYNATYIATLQVKTISGYTNTSAALVFVANNAPVVRINANTTLGYPSLAVAYNATIRNGNSPFSYSWDFTNDGIYDSTSTNPVYVFATEGNYITKLRIVDVDGDIAFATINITVTHQNTPPIPIIYVPHNNDTFANITPILFVGNATDLEDGQIPSGSLIWSSNVSGYLGSGYSFVQMLPIGTHTIYLTAIDSEGLFASTSVTINVYHNHPPKADFNYIPTNPNTNQTIIFISNSTDLDNDIVAYAWDFNNDNITDAITPIATYQYNLPGNYPVKLTVTDSLNQADSITKIVPVTSNLQIARLDCFDPIVVYHNQSCTVEVRANGILVPNASVSIYYTNSSLFGTCTTDRLSGACQIITPVSPIGVYTLYANAFKPNYINITGTNVNYTFHVITQRYNITNLAVYNNSAYTIEHYDYYRNQIFWVKFQVIDLLNNNAPVNDIITAAALVSPPGGKVNLSVFKTLNDGWYYYWLNPVPPTHSFLGQSQVFTFAYNFSDNTGGQQQVTLTIRNNPPKIIGLISNITTLVNTSYSIDLTPYEYDIEDWDTNLTWIATTYNTSQFIATINPITDVLTITPLSVGYGPLNLTLYDLDLDSAWQQIFVNTLALSIPNATQYPPVAIPGGNYFEKATFPITFDGSRSYDIDGYIVNYNWNFGDGTFGSGAIINHVYTTAGNYTVFLTVTDNSTLTNTNFTYAIIQPYKPMDVDMVVTLNGDQNCAPTEYQFWATPKDGIGRYDYIWDFGDGTSYHKGDINQVTYHTYKNPGTFIVKLYATDQTKIWLVKQQELALRACTDDHIPRQKVYIEGINIVGGECIMPGDDADIALTFENTGIYKMKNVKATVWIPDIDVTVVEGPFQLGAGKEVTEHLRFTVPPNTPDGLYDMRIVVSDDKVRRVRYRTLLVKSNGCYCNQNNCCTQVNLCE